jgi:hypothetical protein
VLPFATGRAAAETMLVISDARLSQLFEVDPTTGAVTYLGATGFFLPDHRNAIAGLAFHPTTNVRYGVDNGVGSYTDALYTVNTTTGVATLVGQFLGDRNVLGVEFLAAPVTVDDRSWGFVKALYR